MLQDHDRAKGIISSENPVSLPHPKINGVGSLYEPRRRKPAFAWTRTCKSTAFIFAIFSIDVFALENYLPFFDPYVELILWEYNKMC